MTPNPPTVDSRKELLTSRFDLRFPIILSSSAYMDSLGSSNRIAMSDSISKRHTTPPHRTAIDRVIAILLPV